MYHLVSGQVHTWSETNVRVKSAIKSAKEEVIRSIRLSTGLLLDSPTSSGGNTNNEPVADFFAVKERESFCAPIMNEEHRVNFALLLSKFNIMLKISQQCDLTKKVDPIKVKELGHDLMIFIKQKFPFAMLSPSVHQMCTHN